MRCQRKRWRVCWWILVHLLHNGMTFLQCLKQFWSVAVFSCAILFLFFYRSRLCGVWRGAHPAQWSVRCLQSHECHQDQKKSGADGHAATKQPARVWVCTTTAYWTLFHCFTAVWIWSFLLFPSHRLQIFYFEIKLFILRQHILFPQITAWLISSRRIFWAHLASSGTASSTPYRTASVPTPHRETCGSWRSERTCSTPCWLDVCR